MRMWLVLLWLMVMALPAGALPTKVSSGEHGAFTRLVFDFDGPVDWTVSRTGDGYAMRVRGAAPAYDLSEVFALIERRRLAAIWVDPASGALQLGVGCACHAIPFAFRPDIVVIDLLDGPPPKGSSFELGPDGAVMAALGVAVTPPPETARAEYDWTRPLLIPEAEEKAAGMPVTLPDSPPDSLPDSVPGSMSVPTPAAAPAHEAPAHEAPQMLPLGDMALEPLREALLQQLSRGAARGVVDIAEAPEPPETPDASETEPADFASARFRLGEQATISIAGRPSDDGQMNAQGGRCVADDRLALASWIEGGPVSGQMGGVMTGLTGEFDHPDPLAVARAVRFDLALGFGAEARMLLQVFPQQQEDAALWTSLAHLLDGEADSPAAFAGMLSCDTSAAMWALLSDPPPVKGDVMATGAIQRAFSALPLHLRRHLGPRVADRFLAMDEAAAAFVIQQAILRVSGDAGPEVALMEARIAAHGGDLDTATARTDAVLDDHGPSGAEALAAMVELKAESMTPTGSDTVQALEAYVKEWGDGPESAALRRALTLAYALSGDFAAALAEPDQSAQTAADIWRLLARLGPDDQLLELAVLAPAQAPPAAAQGVAGDVARRLLGLGFADQAGLWAAHDPAADQMFLVDIALQRRDGRAALRVLAGREDAQGQQARAAALQLLGDEPGVAATFAALGEDEAEWAALRRAQDWSRVAEAGPDSWQAAAATVLPAPPPAEPLPGPLAASQALLEASAATRQALTDLLAEVPPP